MTDQVFADSEKQLIVAVTEGALTFTPTGRPGWQCRLDDVAWTSSRMDPHRGVTEVRLHASDGRVAAVIPEFEQMPRFYVALLRRLTSRPFFDSVRDYLPTRVELLERVLWIAGQTSSDDGPWERLEIEENGAVIAQRGALVLALPHADHLERIPWEDLAGFRYRVTSPFVLRDATRFYQRTSYVELPMPGLRPDLGAAIVSRMAAYRESGAEAVTYQPPGTACAFPNLALQYSWELDGAREAGILARDEPVISCAFGRGRGQIANSPAETTSLLDSLAGMGRTPASSLQLKTELFLTERRLIQVDLDVRTGAIIHQHSLPQRGAPRPRRSPQSILIGEFELITDAAQPLDMAPEFVENYKTWMRSHLQDPFSTELALDLPPA